jgi:hypothetical protein
MAKTKASTINVPVPAPPKSFAQKFVSVLPVAVIGLGAIFVASSAVLEKPSPQHEPIEWPVVVVEEPKRQENDQVFQVEESPSEVPEEAQEAQTEPAPIEWPVVSEPVPEPVSEPAEDTPAEPELATEAQEEPKPVEEAPITEEIEVKEVIEAPIFVDDKPVLFDPTTKKLYVEPIKELKAKVKAKTKKKKTKKKVRMTSAHEDFMANFTRGMY